MNWQTEAAWLSDGRFRLVLHLHANLCLPLLL